MELLHLGGSFHKKDRGGMMEPYIFGVSGQKNTGKTKLMCGLVRELTKRGFKVATIKHDGHEFEPDRPGTDSFCHYEAGAFGTAVFSDTTYMVVKRERTTAMELAKLFPEADVILVEGMKHGLHPKFETVRDFGEIVSAPETLCALVANPGNTKIRERASELKIKVPIYAYSEIPLLCDIIETGIRQKGSKRCQKIQ